MFSSTKNIENLQQLFAEVKDYVELQKEYVVLDFVNKMTILLSALILGAILFLLGTIAILYLSFTFATFLANYVGGMPASCAIVTGLFVILGLVVYKMRLKWIINPLTNFLVHLFINKKDKEKQ